MTLRILMGCAHRRASSAISFRKRVAGPKIPPPKMIFSGSNRLTRLALAMPQYKMASASISAAIASPCSYAAKTSRAVGWCAPGCRDLRSANCLASPWPDACDSKQPHETYSGMKGRLSASQPIAPAMPRLPWSTRPSARIPAPMPVPTARNMALRQPWAAPCQASPRIYAARSPMMTTGMVASVREA